MLGFTSGSKTIPVLPPALEGERRETTNRAGPMVTYVQGEGPPLLLLHSINAAASAYEVKPIVGRMTGERRIFAPDLPGFGHSDRSDRRYDIRLYTDAIHDVVDLIEAEAGASPIDVLALSLTSEFLARAALERPERFRSLALITPTGFNKGAHKRRGPEGATLEVPGLYTAVARLPWAQALFDLLTSRRGIRFFLRKTLATRHVDPDYLEYDWITARQPGARHAPFAFVSGRLFSKEVRAHYERLELPVWLAHGVRGDFADFSEADWVESRPNWTHQSFPTGALPHFQRPETVVEHYRAFLATVG